MVADLKAVHPRPQPADDARALVPPDHGEVEDRGVPGGDVVVAVA